MSIPRWHEIRLDHRDVISMQQIADLHEEFTYDSVRSWATKRRSNRYLGPMPDPVAVVANRKLWLRTEIEAWMMPMQIPKWRRRTHKLSG